MSEISRRDFLKTSAFLGGAVALNEGIQSVFSRLRLIPDGAPRLSGEYDYLNNKPENTLYSVCLNCHTACTIKGKIVDGVLVKIDGNPYSVTNRLPNLPYEMDPVEAAHFEGKVCPKGQGGVPVLYDPYRLRKVLKRAGKRGENKWVTIEWEQFIDEVVEGGDLFGEGQVSGLKDIWKLRDPAVAKALKEDASAVARGDLTIEDFKQKHASHLGLLIDPDHPDFGPVNNQFAFMAGRIEHGRKEFGKRFTYSSFGSNNFFEHTSICEQSHHIAFKEVTRNPKTGKKKEHFKPDLLETEYVIFFGTGAFEANFGPPSIAEKVTDSLVNRKNFTMVVVDPRLSKTAAQADWWLPIAPGGDAALALGMIRWMIEHERFDRQYLENPNPQAAAVDDETTWTDATHLVRTDTLKFLTAGEAGLSTPADGTPPFRVVMTPAGPALADLASGGDLTFSGEVNGLPVQTAFSLLKARAFEKSLDEYAADSGLRVKDITGIADEFTSHGKKAVAEFYRGPVKHTSGYYNAQAIILLNILIGNADWKGGWSAGGGHWHEDGSHGGPFPKSLVAGAAPGGLASFGVKITREGSAYENSTLFRDENYPAKRNWYPFTGNVYQEVLPSASDRYPYPLKALLIHKGTPALSVPAGDKQIPTLMDPTVIPLIISCDIVVGETSMYADYVLPDLTYMERWGTSHVSPDNQVRVSKVRQPMVAPLTEIVTVDGEPMPISLEAFLISVGKKLGLPGFGKGGFGEKGDFNRPEDFFLKLVANIAWGDAEDGSDAVPEGSSQELELFRQAHRYLPAEVFDETRWKAALGGDESLWKRVVYVLNRGGRFEPFGNSYQGEKLAHQYKGPFNLFVERVAQARNSITGKHFDGLPKFELPKNGLGEVTVDDGYPLRLITYKEITGGQSRTIASYWLSSILPENYVLMNSRDAKTRGIRSGDLVRILSKSNPDGMWDLGHGRLRPVEGKAMVIEGLRPGVVAASWHYGHWNYGASDIEVDGAIVPGDPRRGSGLCTNALIRIDDATGNTCLADPIGGSVSFYDTQVKVKKV